MVSTFLLRFDGGFLFCLNGPIVTGDRLLYNPHTAAWEAESEKGKSPLYATTQYTQEKCGCIDGTGARNLWYNVHHCVWNFLHDYC